MRLFPAGVRSAGAETPGSTRNQARVERSSAAIGTLDPQRAARLARVMTTGGPGWVRRDSLGARMAC